jgi:hypothetical protein
MAADFDLTAVARSLLNIEVNTILRDCMTGEPMPPAPHALLDIAGWYAQELCKLGVNLPAWFMTGTASLEELDPPWEKSPAPVSEQLTVSPDTFDRLRWAAKWALARLDRAPSPVPDGERALLDRIVNNSDSIKEMFKRFDAGFNNQFLNRKRTDLADMTIRRQSYMLQPEDIILLQKIWDIGTEQIAMQTIVLMTGDVTTRLQQALTGPRAELLFGIHRQSVEVSVGRWKVLLDAVVEVAKGAFGTLLGRR